MSPQEKEESIWSALRTTVDRVTELEVLVKERTESLRTTIKEAVAEAMPSALLSDDEHRWLQNAIKRQEQSIDFRNKVIQGTATWTMIALLIWIGIVLKEYIFAHGWKP